MERDKRIIDEIFGILSSESTPEKHSSFRGSVDTNIDTKIESDSDRVDYECNSVKQTSKPSTNSENISKILRVKSEGTDERYKCNECGKRYANSSSFSTHKQRHSQWAKSCDVCGKDYASKTAFSAHLLTHIRPHTCGVCTKSFATVWLLEIHLRLHTGEKPYGCLQCGKEFADPSNLRVHLRIHSGLKLFKCDLCEKSFATKQNVVVHLRSHTGEKPFTCTHCSKSFSDQSTFRRHLVRMHTFTKGTKSKTSKRKQTAENKSAKNTRLELKCEVIKEEKYSPMDGAGGCGFNNGDSTITTEGLIIVKTEDELVID